MELDGKQKRKGIRQEIIDLLTSAAFPFMLQPILSASIILFADYSGDKALQIVILVFGEILLAGAYVVFGRQNGVTAYRRTVQHKTKRSIDGDNAEANLKTGDYAVWKGIVIGVISVIPFMLVQLIHCLAPNTVCEFILKYAFGWAEYPFIVIGGSNGEISQWFNFIWIIFPIGVHAAAYIIGAGKEAKRQAKVEEAQEIRKKRK